MLDFRFDWESLRKKKGHISMWPKCPSHSLLRRSLHLHGVANPEKVPKLLSAGRSRFVFKRLTMGAHFTAAANSAALA